MTKSLNIFLIVDNVRSAHNVGSLIRTAEGLGIKEVALCGYTPYPRLKIDNRPPYLADKITRRISKTALGAEDTLSWKHFDTTLGAIKYFRNIGADIVALEQTASAEPIENYKPDSHLALVVGNEIDGISAEVLAECDDQVYIPMAGSKESFNVAVASAMAMFYLTLML